MKLRKSKKIFDIKFSIKNARMMNPGFVVTIRTKSGQQSELQTTEGDAN